MGAISTVAIQTRLDICEVLNRYCHYVDHDNGDAWAALFTPDGVFDVPGVMRLQGRDQLRTMPGLVQEHGGGRWRHQITNILIDHSLTPREMQVSAYGLVTDWNKGGQPVSFTDYRIRFQNGGCWQIAQLKADSVAGDPT